MRRTARFAALSSLALPLDLRTRTEVNAPLGDNVKAITTVPDPGMPRGRERASARAILRAKTLSAPLLAGTTFFGRAAADSLARELALEDCAAFVAVLFDER